MGIESLKLPNKTDSNVLRKLFDNLFVSTRILFFCSADNVEVDESFPGLLKGTIFVGRFW